MGEFEQWHGIVCKSSEDCSRTPKHYGLVLMSDDQNTVVLPTYRVEDDIIFYDECADGDKENMDNVQLESGFLAFPELCSESLVRRSEHDHKCYVVAREDSLEVWLNDECRRTRGRGSIMKSDQDNILDHMRPRHLQRDRYREILMERCQKLLADEHAAEPVGLFQKPGRVSMAAEPADLERRKKKPVQSELCEGSGELQKALAVQSAMSSDLPVATKKEQCKEKTGVGDREYDG